MFSLYPPPATHECPPKISAHSVQPFSRTKGTYISECLVLFIEKNIFGDNILYILFRYVFGDKSSWKYIWMAVVLGSNIIAGKAPCSII